MMPAGPFRSTHTARFLDSASSAMRSAAPMVPGRHSVSMACVPVSRCQAMTMLVAAWSMFTATPSAAVAQSTSVVSSVVACQMSSV